MTRESERERGRRPRWRKWILLLGAFVLFVVAFDRLERLVPAPRSEAPAPPDRPPRPVRPTVTRLHDRVEVKVGMHRTTVRLSEEEGSMDDLVDCIEAGLDRAVADGRLTRSPSGGWIVGLRRDAKIAEEMNRIIHPCVGLEIGGDLP